MKGQTCPLSPYGGRGPGRGGSTLAPQRNLNGANNPLKVSDNLAIAEPQHPIPARCQCLSAGSISQLTPHMRLPINLDHETFRASREVSNIRRQHHLPLKLDAQLPSTQHSPEHPLRPCHVAAKFLRALPGGFVSLGHSPSPNPLPLKGERAHAVIAPMLKRIFSIALPCGGILLSSGCAAAGSFSQSQFDEISDQCGLPRSTLTLQGKGELRFQPPSDLSFEAWDCAFQKVKEPNFPGLRLVLIGNERIQTEAK